MESVKSIVRNRIIETREVDADELKLHPYNWRIHPDEQKEAVEGILSEVGIVQTLVAYYSERNGGALTLIDGHLRKGLGGKWPVTITDLTDAEADLILATLHPSGDLAKTDSGVLADLLAQVNLTPVESPNLIALLDLVASRADDTEPHEDVSRDYGDHEDDDAEAGEVEEDEPKKAGEGTLLKLVNVTVGEPRHHVKHGEIYQMGPHFLVVADVVTDWPIWTRFLRQGRIFAPYPGPFVALSKKADDIAIVMVQPDTYVAGHVLDRFADVKGEDSVRKID